MCKRSRKKKFSSSLRPFEVYRRPFAIIEKPLVTLSEFHFRLRQSYQRFYVVSNQPEFLFSIKKVIRDPVLLQEVYTMMEGHIDEVCDILIRKCLNSNTFLRSYLDAFWSDPGNPYPVCLYTAFEKKISKNTRTISYDTLLLMTKKEFHPVEIKERVLRLFGLFGTGDGYIF